jgi:hypothetical protein
LVARLWLPAQLVPVAQEQEQEPAVLAGQLALVAP